MTDIIVSKYVKRNGNAMTTKRGEYKVQCECGWWNLNGEMLCGGAMTRHKPEVLKVDYTAAEMRIFANVAAGDPSEPSFRDMAKIFNFSDQVIGVARPLGTLETFQSECDKGIAMSVTGRTLGNHKENNMTHNDSQRVQPVMDVSRYTPVECLCGTINNPAAEYCSNDLHKQIIDAIQPGPQELQDGYVWSNGAGHCAACGVANATMFTHRYTSCGTQLLEIFGSWEAGKTAFYKRMSNGSREQKQVSYGRSLSLTRLNGGGRWCLKEFSDGRNPASWTCTRENMHTGDHASTGNYCTHVFAAAGTSACLGPADHEGLHEDWKGNRWSPVQELEQQMLGRMDRTTSGKKCFCGKPVNTNNPHSVFCSSGCAVDAADAVSDMYKPANRALSFIAGLNLQDHPVAEQREAVVIVRELMKALKPKKSKL